MSRDAATTPSEAATECKAAERMLSCPARTEETSSLDAFVSSGSTAGLGGTDDEEYVDLLGLSTAARAADRIIS